MSTVIDGIFLLDAVRFFMALVVAFYIPGNVWLQSVFLLPSYAKLAFSFLVGMSMWAVVGVFLGFLNIRNGQYVYLAVCFLLFIYQRKVSFRWNIPWQRIDWYSGVLMFFGVLVQLSGVWFMGIETANGVTACCGHVPDNHLFLAITNELTHRFPPQEPGVAGVSLGNYHYLGHLIVADLIRIFHLPLIATSFQFMSVVLSVSLGLSAIVFVSVLNLNSSYRRWLLFFLYFGADAVFLLVLLLNTQFLFYFAAMESGAGFLFNYPRAFSIIMLFTGLSLLVVWMKTKKYPAAFLVMCVLGSTLSYKAYTGVFVWAGMLGIFLWSVYKRDLKSALLAVAVVVFGMKFFMPGDGQSGGMFYSGLWRVHDFFAMPELGLSGWLLARNIFVEHANWPRIWFLDIRMIIIFLWVTFGTKLIALVQNTRSLAQLPHYIHWFFFVSLMSNFVVGMFFLQNIGGSTSVNFLITVVILISVYAAASTSYFLSSFSQFISIVVTSVILVMTVPRALYVTYENFQKIPRIGFQNTDISFFKEVRKIIPQDALVLPVGYGTDYSELYLSYMIDRKLYVLASMNSQKAKDEETKRRKIFEMFEIHSDPVLLDQMLRVANIEYILVRNPVEIPMYHPPLFQKIGESSCCRLYKYTQI